MSDPQLDRTGWQETITAAVAVIVLLLTLVGGGYTILSRLDVLSAHVMSLDDKIQSLGSQLRDDNNRQDRQLDDHEKRLRALELRK
jgi:hypothetical protein